MPSDSSFWRTYHSLLNWVDGDGLPDPDKLDAAHWMLELREACKQGAIDSSKAFKMCCAGLDATEKRTKVFPLTIGDEKEPTRAQ